jgi:nanoRNase/pAp phosphatase (c-di-AMP/oligoRNAs hydrolase)
MYKQIAWVLDRDDFHPSVKELMNADFVTEDLQASYDALLKSWQPDEIVLLDGPVNKLGFDSRGVEVFNIDHHTAAGTQDDESAYIKRAPSAGCLLIDRYHIYDPILAVSILTDTFWLRQNDPASATHYLDLLVDHGMTNEQLAEIQRRLKIQKDPVILKAIAEAEMRITGDTIFMVLKTADKEIHRGVMSECGYFSRHICVIRNDGYASLRTDDPNIDLRPLARKFSGGGHAAIAAVVLREFAAPDNVMKEQKKQAVERLYQAFLEVVAPQGKGSAGKT